MEIWRHCRYRRLWLIGSASGSARWLEVLCFSVLAWQITNDATMAGWFMTLRMAGVMLSGGLFMFIGSRVSGQHVMIVMHALAAATCAFGLLVVPSPDRLVLIFALVSFLSGMLWSVDFSFRRRMLADSLPSHLVASGVALDVMSSHATRLTAMLVGGFILGFGDPQMLLGSLLLLYAGSGLFLFRDGDMAVSRNARATETLRAVFRQASSNRSILTVLALTPIFNIFVLPYLALIALVFLERFDTGPTLAGSLVAIEGVGTILGGVAISLVQPKRPLTVFVTALSGLLIALLLIGSLPLVVGVVLVLFCAGMMTSIYSSMQSSLIYTHSEANSRSQTFSLMTLSIGSGLLGTINVSWMGHFLSVSEIVMVMAGEGAVAALLILLWIWRAAHRAHRADGNRNG